MRKLIYGLLVAAGALVFSAYTNAQQEYFFYNVSNDPQSTDEADYEYQPAFDCAISSENCSVSETLAAEPAVGANPSPSAMGNIQKGTAIP